MNKNAKIYISGHRGLAGSAIVRRLDADGFENLLLRSSRELDLADQKAVGAFMAAEKPDYVIMAAGRVGGIQANMSFPAEFMYQNMMMALNVIHAAFLAGVPRLLYLASSCIYPRLCPQPMREEYLLTGALEPTNEAYALAKVAGVKMCEYYRRQYGLQYLSVMPPNLYGPGDHFDLASCHVLQALLRRAHEARERGDAELLVWGTGRPRREWLYVDDLAEACLFFMQHDEIGAGLYNVGFGRDYSIEELARMAMAAVGFKGDIRFDAHKPDGMPQKLLDVSGTTALGWQAKVGLEEGLPRLYEYFLQQKAAGKI